MLQMEQDGILVSGDRTRNAPLLVIPKKEDVSGTKKYRVVKNFHKLNNERV